MIMSNRGIHIVGGARGIGRWFADKVFLEHTSLFCYDVDPKALNKLPNYMSGCLLSETDHFDKYEKNFQPNDWYLLSVPPDQLENTARSLSPHLKENSLVISMNSVQKPAMELLDACVPSCCSYLGCHPLFGDTVFTPAGQLVALISFKDDLYQHKEFNECLSSAGLIVTHLNAEEHDNYMGVVQALTHFALMVFGGTIAQNDLHPSELLKLRTPNFQFLYAFTSRILKIASTTTGSIQATSQASNIRKLFLKTAQKLHGEFEATKEVQSCARVIEALRAPLTGAEVDEGAEIAAVAVDSLQRFEELLLKYRRSAAPFIFRHRKTGQVHVVRVVAIKHDEIVIEESTKIIQTTEGLRYAIGLADSARRNYKKLGISLSLPSRKPFKKRNIKLLSAEELNDFWNNSILTIQTEHNFQNKYQVGEDYFERWLPLLLKGLLKCEFVDGYRKRKEIEKVTLKLTFSANLKREEIIESVRKVVEEQTLLNEGKNPPL